MMYPRTALAALLLIGAYDARGTVTQETLQDGSTIAHEHDANGAASKYRDQTLEATRTTTDKIGRPTLREYPDSTHETWTYDGPRLASYTDRQDRVQRYTYNDKGQLIEIRDAATLLDKLEYDAAGRLVRWTRLTP